MGKLTDKARAIIGKQQWQQNLLEWHKDSHPLTKNEDGTPKVFYHGTGADFEEFKISKGIYGQGIYFAEDPKLANIYSYRDNGEPNVMPVYLKMQNPLVLKEGDKLLPYIVMVDKGHDGLIIDLNKDNQYIVFNPNQIKSIHNQGTFDENSAVITDSIASIIKSLVSLALTKKNEFKEIVVEKITPYSAQRVKQFTGLMIEGYSAILDTDHIRHTYRGHKTDIKYLDNIKDFLDDFDYADKSTIKDSKTGKILTSLLLYKKYTDDIIRCVQLIDFNNKELRFKTIFKVDKPDQKLIQNLQLSINAKKKSSLDLTPEADSVGFTHQLDDNDIITKNTQNVKQDAIFSYEELLNLTYTEPTEAQKIAGNYHKPKIKLQGMAVSIENLAGSTRKGNGWEVVMQDHYGYINRTYAIDGDHLDIFVNAAAKKEELEYLPIYVIEQIDSKTGIFDEFKLIAGAENKEHAKEIYLRNYAKGWKGFGAVGLLTNYTKEILTDSIIKSGAEVMNIIEQIKSETSITKKAKMIMEWNKLSLSKKAKALMDYKSTTTAQEEPKMQNTKYLSDDMKLLLEKYPQFNSIVDDIPFSTAQNAHHGTSFSPEKRAVSEINGYIHDVIKFYSDLIAFAEDDNKDAFKEEFKKFVEGYKKRVLAHLYTRSRLLSPMITGGSNFNTRQRDKVGQQERNKAEDMVNYYNYKYNKIKSILVDSGVITLNTDDDFAKLIARRDATQKLQEQMKEVNRRIKKEGYENITNILNEVGMSAEVASKNYIEEGGFPHFRLTNNNAKLKSDNEKIAAYNKKKEIKDKGGIPDWFYTGVTVHHNFDNNRIQLIFDERPSKEEITMLKKKAFKWSPKESAWQRQLTGNAQYAVRDLMKEMGREKVNSMDSIFSVTQDGIETNIVHRYKRAAKLTEKARIVLEMKLLSLSQKAKAIKEYKESQKLPKKTSALIEVKRIYWGGGGYRLTKFNQSKVEQWVDNDTFGKIGLFMDNHTVVGYFQDDKILTNITSNNDIQSVLKSVQELGAKVKSRIEEALRINLDDKEAQSGYSSMSKELSKAINAVRSLSDAIYFYEDFIIGEQYDKVSELMIYIKYFVKVEPRFVDKMALKKDLKPDIKYNEYAEAIDGTKVFSATDVKIDFKKSGIQILVNEYYHQALRMADSGNPKKELNGVMLEIKDNKAKYVSTDTRRLYISSEFSFRFADGVYIIPKIKDGVVSAAIDNEDVYIEYKDFIIKTKLITGKFPAYQRIDGEPLPSMVKFQLSNEMVKDIKSVQLTYKALKKEFEKKRNYEPKDEDFEIKNVPEKSLMVQISVTSNEMKMQVIAESRNDNGNSKVFTYQIERDKSFSDKQVQITCNKKYLLDAIDTQSSIIINESNLPFKVQGKNGTTIVMPIVL
ncbi:MAG: ADP-ribosyltransferase-containing protein [Sulfurovaceae bacterium]